MIGGRPPAAVPHPAGAPARELTCRALITGMAIGAVLTPTNIYSGLKIGWSFNLSITALLIAFVFWRPVARLLRLPPWELHESNINQTAASAAASIISGGLVAPIPAYLLLTGDTLALAPLTAWVFSVSFLGVWVAWFLRAPMVGNPHLRYPVGIATAETLRDMFEHGREALLRFWAMLASLVGAAVFKLGSVYWWTLPRLVPSARLEQLTFGLDPSLMMLGFGTLIGPRAGWSLLAGAVLAWGLIAPWLLAGGHVDTGGSAAGSAFQPLVGWLIWPGVSLMVAASITSIACRPARRAALGRRPRLHFGWSVRGFVAAATLAVVLQVALFGIGWFAAVLAIPVAFALAAVAARVVGETGIPPIGAVGKVSQLSFAVIAPGQAVTNLMTANVAGGAAGQCADLLNDFKAGALVGATPWKQAAAQCGGILIGSVVGSAVFLALIPEPSTQLLTAEWPAPAVAVWKAVAEALSLGFDSVPPAARYAALAGAVAGCLLALAENRLGRWAAWLPSGATLGLAFVIPASTSMTLFVGALAGHALHRRAPRWSTRFLIACAAGLIAGESLLGVFVSIARLG